VTIRFPVGHFLLVVFWNQASISNGFQDIQWRMWHNGWQLDMTWYAGESVAPLVARQTNNQPTIGVLRVRSQCVSQCWQITAWGELPAVAGLHSFFRAVRSWSLDGLGSGVGNGKSGRQSCRYARLFPALYNIASHLSFTLNYLWTKVKGHSFWYQSIPHIRLPIGCVYFCCKLHRYTILSLSFQNSDSSIYVIEPTIRYDTIR